MSEQFTQSELYTIRCAMMDYTKKIGANDWSESSRHYEKYGKESLAIMKNHLNIHEKLLQLGVNSVPQDNKIKDNMPRITGLDKNT